MEGNWSKISGNGFEFGEFWPWFIFRRFLILEVRTVWHVRVQGTQGLRVATRVSVSPQPSAHPQVSRVRVRERRQTRAARKGAVRVRVDSGWEWR